ncbi:uncharacterized protein LOC143459349 isoform X2 [Clavelina lepadiformis]|uniref:uncharacterized protein LOC143459349 isoform X2 n=1 Tax=Clavelina lepadiformis TaxID=159417 RepID=UPI004041DDE7
MLNRIRKTFRDTEHQSPGQHRQPSNSQRRENESSPEHTGFICPICMVNQKSAEELQRHFDVAHSTPDQPDSTLKPQTNDVISDSTHVQEHSPQHIKTEASPPRSNGIGGVNNAEETGNENYATSTSNSNNPTLVAEIEDLQASLKEEKWYTSELKKEIASIQNEKVNISADYETLQAQLQIATATNEELARQKELLEKKAMNLAQTIAGVKAENDELESQKVAVEERCQNQSIELEKAAAWVRDLESQLPPGHTVESIVKEKLQRPGVDDVMVLKKELVSVQTLMDQMTQESEKKSKEVENDRQHLQNLLDEAKQQAEVVQREFDLFRAENARLKVENKQTAAEKDESTKLLQQEKDDLNKLYSQKENTKQEEIVNLLSSLEKEQGYSHSLSYEINQLQEEKSLLKNDVARLSEELENSKKLCEDEQSRFSHLNNEYLLIEAAKSDAEAKLLESTKKIEKLCEEYERAITEKEARLDAVYMEKDELESQLNENKATVEHMKQEKNNLERRFDEIKAMSKQVESESSSVQHDLHFEIAQLKMKLETFEADNIQLLGGKKTLEDNVEKMKNDHNDERNNIQSKVLELQQELVVLKMQSNQINEQKNQMERNLIEAHSKLEDARKTFEETQEKNHVLNTNFAVKSQEMESLKEKLIMASNKLDEEIARRESSTEEAAKLREERTVLMAQMEAGEGEAVARAQIAEENDSLRMQKEEALQKLRSESSEHELAMQSINAKLAEVNASLVSIQEKYESSQQLVIKIKDDLTAEKEKSMQLEADFKVKAELLLTTQAASATQRADMESHLNSVKWSLEEKTKELEKRNADLTSLQSAMDDLKTQVNQQRQDYHLELANLKSNFDKMEREKQDAHEDVSRLRIDLEDAKRAHQEDNERRNEAMKATETKHAEKIASLNSILKDVKDDLQVKTKEHSEQISMREAIEKNLDETKKQAANLEETCNTTKLELDEILEELTKVKEAFEASQLAHQNEVEERKKESSQFEERQKDLEVKMNRDSDQYNEEINKLKEEAKNQANVLENERLLKTKSEEALKSAESCILSHQEDISAKEKLLNKMRSERNEIEQRLNSEISDHHQKIVMLEESLVLSRSETEKKVSEVNQKSEVARSTQDELDRVKSELESMTTHLTETEVDLENSKTELNEVRLISQQLKNSKTDLEEKSAVLERVNEDHIKKINDMEEQLSSSCEDNVKLNGDITNIKEKLRLTEDEAMSRKIEWDEKSSEFETEVRVLQESLKSMKTDLDAEKHQRQEDNFRKEDEMKRLLEEWSSQESLWTSEKDAFLEKVDSLEAAQSLLLGHKVELQKSINALQTSLENEKKTAFEAQEKAKANSNLQELKITDLKTQIEKKNNELEESAAEKVVSESRLQLEIGALTENLNSTRSEWVATTQRVDATTRENDDLRGQLVVLNATVQNNADERRTLLERCLNAEQQVEQMTSRFNELRRKLDDAHSAMHELGRENQALQVKHTTTISRQWADDKNINQCKACSRNFSLTVRKHHCRHCGDIFCAECSSRNATVASSKNPVRVCERCYDDLLVAG